MTILFRNVNAQVEKACEYRLFVSHQASTSIIVLVVVRAKISGSPDSWYVTICNEITKLQIVQVI